jgi:short-subunit dehydrogenase involved in D-alanine esterification of teichoic acids
MGPIRPASAADWAIVTGASSGLGREFALALAERGRSVLVVARREDRLRLLAEEVRARGGQLEPLIADLSTREGIDAVWQPTALSPRFPASSSSSSSGRTWRQSSPSRTGCCRQ